MFNLPIPAEVWRECARDPALQRRFDEALRREQNRYIAWQREAERSSGVRVSGCDVDPWVGLTAEDLLSRPKAALAETEAFKASPEGKVAQAMRECADIATHINMAVEQVRAASARSFVGSLPRIDRLLADLDDRRNQLRASVRDAQMALDDAYAANGSGDDRPPLLLAAAEIVGANVVRLRGRS